MEKRIAVIGAGATGLAAAYDLAKNGYAPVVFEAEPHIGGLAAVHDAGGVMLGNHNAKQF